MPSSICWRTKTSTKPQLLAACFFVHSDSGATFPLFLRYPAALLPCCPAALLPCCPAALLSCCPAPTLTRAAASGSDEPAQSNLPPAYHAPHLRGGLPHLPAKTTGNSPLDDTHTIAVGIPPKVPPQSDRFLNADGLQPATQAEGRAASHHHSGLLVGTWSSLVRIVSGRLGVAQQLLLILTGEGPPVPSLANKRSPRPPPGITYRCRIG